MSHVAEITGCRSCGHRRLDSVLDFGSIYISDFLATGDIARVAPMHVVRCQGCGLVQLLHTVDQDVLFRKYWYRSGTNESMREALADVVRCVIQHRGLLLNGPVLDIGANDGALLSCYPTNIERIGIEPAQNLGWRYDDIERVSGFWPVWLGKRFEVITSIATFYAAPDPNGYVAAIKEHLAPDGVWIVQMQDAWSVLRDTATDYWCHEHLCLWDDSSFNDLVIRHGLQIVERTENAVNGGSARYVVKHAQGFPSVGWLRPAPTLADWQRFALHSKAHAQAAHRFLEVLASNDARLLGVAASTKANTMLQFCDIDRSLLPAIVDRAPEKWGLTTPNGIPIISEDEGRARNPTCYVALAWHFLDGLRARDPGVPFVTLLPGIGSYPPLECPDREVAALPAADHVWEEVAV